MRVVCVCAFVSGLSKTAWAAHGGRRAAGAVHSVKDTSREYYSIIIYNYIEYDIKFI